ncbi:MAG: transcription-repair coupling factor [Chloroflexi bacterium]|nr:MAG: transcription-repair coupling factor [Chloroflexota bacterium]
MQLSGLLPLLQGLPAYQALLDQPTTEPQALLQSARPYVVAGLKTHRPGALILLTARSELAQQLADQLEHWLPAPDEGGPPIYLFAEPDALPFERIAWSGRTRQQRLTALAALQSRSGIRPLVVASARALMQKTLPARELRLALRQVKMGSVVRLEQMTTNWVQTGYNPADVVEEPGTFARRGGIIDIWPPNLPQPVRIDLFGDEVDSLRLFDPATQRSQQHIDAVEIGPGSEALSKYGPAALTRLGIQGDHLLAPENLATTSDALSPLQDPNLLLAIREQIRVEVEHLAQGHSFHGIEWYLPYFYDQPASLLDYLGEDATLVVDDASELFATLSELEGQAANLRLELERSGELPRDFRPNYFTGDELRQKLAGLNPILLGYGDLYGKATSANTPLARSFAPGPRYGGKTKEVVAEVVQQRAEGHRTVLVTRQAARLQELLHEAGLIAHVQSDLTEPPPPQSLTLIQGVVGEGFVIKGLENKRLRDQEIGQPPGNLSISQSLNLYFFTDTELFGWSKPQARRRSQAHSSVAPEIFFADVKAGDFVVHLEHGIGQYDGLVKLEVGGIQREYLQVSYARGDKLYVPVHQADRLSRYVGAGERIPVINRLGTADWQLVKERARRAVADIADDLLQLYAEREMARRHVYSPDGPWQEEMEASFPYEETDDQLRAIDAIKQDMESDKPMDRLVVGDVGYGKTEVAVRAAFKAIVDGKQVAMLVPTTVLAQQHYRTISQRLSRFPVRVEMLSRFRTPAQQEQIIRGLQEGTIDFVVGTHRLLSNDVVFKDLGLLIVDEEQRFGVTHKERIKQLRTHVDVLTLSATPIPRTLHMSLSGIRDMSSINTPPKDRLPIHTVLSEWDEVLVRQAVQRELNRKGQVFVVHDRIRGLQHLADRLQHLAPEASIAVAHGQMPERALEDIMIAFAEGEYDVLVATTIIENGLDIPNANTIIINRADHFGLAQLYQLRGRVGRSAQRGHCYLLYEKGTALSYDARRRLAAIMESSEELGAGFRIAMRDLEIRGAGDLLGARQHGHIDSVGFDLYTRLLAQAINDAKRKKERFDKAIQVQGVGEEESREEREMRETSGEAVTGQVAPPAYSAIELEAPFDPADPLAPPVTLDLPIDAKIPQTYIEEEGLRLQMYRRIAGITHLENVDEIRQELIDRFGADEETGGVPEEVENLLFQIRVKILALRAGVEKIGRELDQLVLHSEALENMNRAALQHRIRQGLGQINESDLSPDEMARVARRAIYLPVDEAGHWKTALVRTLEVMAYS